MCKDVERLCKLYKDCIRIIKITRIVEIVETVEKLYKTYENCENCENYENCGRGLADRPLATPLSQLPDTVIAKENPVLRPGNLTISYL